MRKEAETNDKFPHNFPLLTNFGLVLPRPQIFLPSSDVLGVNISQNSLTLEQTPLSYFKAMDILNYLK